MLKHCFDKRVGLKRTTHFFKVCLCLLAVSIHAKPGLAIKIEFLASIIVHHLIKRNHGLFPLADRLVYLFQRHLFYTATPYLLQFIQRPSPFVGVIVCMHLLETCLDIHQTQHSLLYRVEQFGHFVFRSYQPCQIYPISQTYCTIRTQGSTHIGHRMQFLFLQTADETITQEFLNTDSI